ncbi:MAG TPA: chromosome segregation protein SMC, partial [Limnochordia bacterium]|nr:chromosome segregation protein SMC [Limnochordia bacterium]
AAARAAADQGEQRLAEIARLERDAAACRDAAATAQARRVAAQDRLDGARAERDEIQAELERIGADSRAARVRAERALQEAQAAAALLERAGEQLVAATERLAEMGIEAPAETTPASPLGVAELRDELERVRGEIDALGPINPAAEQAWQALAERSAYLEAQRDDLTAAQAHLHDAIRRIDETCRARLAESFSAVNAAFAELFVELFGGGDARLAWSDGDILDAGLDVWVRLPGKRVQNLVALSGGERALSAIAFLFAVLRVKPSPFCVLDEIDAALDDANLARFGRVLRGFTEHTQFIVITHRQVTIEAADVLYGVTMATGGVSSVISLRLEEASDLTEQSG